MLDVTKLSDLDAYIKSAHADWLHESTIANRELTIICRRKDLISLLTFLRDDKNTQFKTLLDICGVDHLGRAERFDVVYHLLSLVKNIRLRIKVRIREDETVPTATGVFSSANWYERETYDMYGIMFENHPDLRRILTDYDFDGHPLRKDFPVEGKVEMWYDDEQKRCVYRPISLKQDFRSFEWQSPWEGMHDNFHLAEEDNPFDAGEFAAPKKD
ncbi:MAG: NADH-quinone oxidoreductase subunit C [Proteobacteria bacterium]|nr:NADH-quinone oxidoreductase subunit C [Pseudomonadota bacterium]